MNKQFPINVFPDVKRNDFNKYTKKNVTEDYIYENLKLQGWRCYKPFTDTGIDLIATKLDQNGNRIYRYIQVKTRKLDKDNFFGYTLKPKDFRTDPRHFFLFFCDTLDDIILIGMYDYMKIFYDNKEMGKTHFANTTFRTDNNKLNSLKHNENGWFWSYRSENGKNTIDFNQFLNEKGLEKMTDTKIDEKIDYYSKEITKMKFEMFYKINKTDKNKFLFEENIFNKVESTLEQMKNDKNIDYIKKINSIDNDYKKEYPQLYISHKKYIYGCSDEEPISDEEENND